MSFNPNGIRQEGFNKLGAWAGYKINVDASVGVHVFVLCDKHNRLCPGLNWNFCAST